MKNGMRYKHGGYRYANKQNANCRQCWKVSPRFGSLSRCADSGSIVQCYCKLDQVHLEGPHVDGVTCGIAVAIVREKVLDRFLRLRSGIELAAFLERKENTDSCEVESLRYA